MKAIISFLTHLSPRRSLTCLLLVAWLCPATIFAAGDGGFFSGDFTQGQVPTAQTVQDWVNFRQTLMPMTYDTVTISGTFDSGGRTLTDAVIVPQIAAALQTGTAGSWTAGGFTWNVGVGCGPAGAVELNANPVGDPSTCACTGSYVVRPQINNLNWGGANTSTCSAPSQTLKVLFCGSDYTVTTTMGASIVPGTTDIGNHCDDCTTTIMLPFPVSFYDQMFSNANVSSNGSLQFTSNNDGCCGFCIPNATFNNIIAALASDLHTDGTNSEGATDGIFTSVSGSAPNRIFNIEWITFFHPNPATTAHFEIRLYEGQPRFDIIYATNTATRLGGVGVQKDTGSEFTAVSCDNGPATGTQYTFTGACPANLATPTLSTVASPNTTHLGATVTDTATVSGGSNPTGTVTFQLFGPNDSTCGSAPVFTSTNPLTGGSATSDPFVPTTPGTYRWIASYDGDANNNPVMGMCNDAGESLVILPPATSVTGSGTIDSPFGGSASFIVNAQFKHGGPKISGNIDYSDPNAGFRLTQMKITSMVFTVDCVHITGTAKLGRRTRVSFTVDACDIAPPGTDSFAISLSNGYSASGNITSGQITFH